MDRDTIRRLAQLAKLRLTADEEDRVRTQIERLLTLFAALRTVPTAGIEPSPYPIPIPHRTRADEVAPVLTQDEVLANAPQAAQGCFRVPRMVEG